MTSLTKLHRGSLDKIRQTVLPIDKTNLEAYWPFWENAGTILYDESKAGYDGTIDGATWDWSAHSKPMLSFDGTDDNVDIPAVPALPAYTIIALVLYDSPSDGDTDQAIGLDANNHVRMRNVGDGTAGVQQKDGGSWHSASVSVSADTWYVITIRWNGSTIEIILDDFSATNSTSVSTMDTSGHTDNLGCCTDANGNEADFLAGDIAWMAVYTDHKPDSFVSNMVHKLKG